MIITILCIFIVLLVCFITYSLCVTRKKSEELYQKLLTKKLHEDKEKTEERK